MTHPINPNPFSPVLAEPEAQKASEGKFPYNPAHACATCGDCGEEMVANVPRLWPDGGAVHKATGRFECASELKEAVSERVEVSGWIERANREPAAWEFPCVLYFGLAMETCRGPSVAHHNFNPTFTHWMTLRDAVKSLKAPSVGRGSSLIAPPVTPNPASPSTAAGEQTL